MYTINASKKNRSKELDDSSAIAIDLGVDNFASIVSTSGKTLLLKGKDHKSRLLYYQHKIAKAKSKFDKDRLRCLKNKLKKAKKQADAKSIKQLDGQIKNFRSSGSTKRIRALNRKVKNINKTYSHKTSKAIAQFALQQRASKITVGKNTNWKNKSRMSRKVNQVFCSMPHSMMIQYLAYKAKSLGISTVEHEESYTSKCDSLALESVEKHSEYLGKRVKRGLFQSSTGKMFNADINGALNIGRKGLKNVFTNDCIRRLRDIGQLFCPESVHDVDLFLHEVSELNMDSIGSKVNILDYSF